MRVFHEINFHKLCIKEKYNQSNTIFLLTKQKKKTG